MVGVEVIACSLLFIFVIIPASVGLTIANFRACGELRALRRTAPERAAARADPSAPAPPPPPPLPGQV
ncbi:hypothetical protein GCM10010343_12010 [Streptomyces avidinii]|nr:hypothetical protein GCM10010343_12010 [Streptomyces avidinii]